MSDPKMRNALGSDFPMIKNHRENRALPQEIEPFQISRRIFLGEASLLGFLERRVKRGAFPDFAQNEIRRAVQYPPQKLHRIKTGQNIQRIKKRNPTANARLKLKGGVVTLGKSHIFLIVFRYRFLIG